MTVAAAFELIRLLNQAIQVAVTAGKRELSAEDMDKIRQQQAQADADYDAEMRKVEGDAP